MQPPATEVRVRALEWVALALWPFVSIYAAYILLGILFGVPDPHDTAAWVPVWRRALAVGGPIGLALMVRGAWSLGEAHWRADEGGLTWGRVRPVRVAWEEVEAVMVGIPGPLPFPLRWLAWVPVGSTRASVRATAQWRATAILLRLRGGRILVFHLLGRQFLGGVAFREHVLARLADRVRPSSELRPEELRVLGRLHVVGIRSTG